MSEHEPQSSIKWNAPKENSSKESLHELGEILRNKRREKRLAIRSLAKKVEISYSFIQAIETGYTPPGKTQPSRPNRAVLEQWIGQLEFSPEEKTFALKLAGHDPQETLNTQQEKESIYKIPLGKRNSRRSPAQKNLQDAGVTVPLTSISLLRGNHTSGKEITKRLKAQEQLIQGNAILKNESYIKIARAGVFLRVKQQSISTRYQSRGYTEQVAEFLKIPFGELRQKIRAMRADLVYGILPETETAKLFEKSVQEFFSHYKGRMRSRRIELIENSWDSSLQNFYRLLYAEPLARQTIGVWASYEMEVLEQYYKEEIAKKNPLTPFDKLLLSEFRDGKSGNDIAQIVRKDTGVKIDNHPISIHLSALINTGDYKKNDTS